MKKLIAEGLHDNNYLIIECSFFDNGKIKVLFNDQQIDELENYLVQLSMNRYKEALKKNDKRMLNINPLSLEAYKISILTMKNLFDDVPEISVKVYDTSKEEEDNPNKIKIRF